MAVKKPARRDQLKPMNSAIETQINATLLLNEAV
jgi:hypothetical protein